MNKLCCILLMVLECQQAIAQGTWTQKANIFTTPRVGAVGFSIGNKGYLGTGCDFNLNAFYNDFWEWDQNTNSWTQMASFAGTARSDAVGFSIGNYGFIATGQNSNGTALTDLWEWNQATNTWSQKAMFPGQGRHNACAFVVGLKGYVGFGSNGGGISDFWEYDQLNDTWTLKAFFGVGRHGCVSFSIDNMGYIIGGAITPWGNLTNEVFEYNVTSNVLTQKANYPGGVRIYAAGFSIGNKGYVGTGWNDIYVTSDFRCFDPALNLWTSKQSYPHPAVYINGAAFSIGCKGYFGTGASSKYIGATLYNDFWEYEPDTCSLTGINESTVLSSELEIFPNPFSEKLNIRIDSYERSEIIIYDINSNTVANNNFINTASINTKFFSNGIYLYEVRNKNGVVKKGKVVKE